MVPLRFHQIQHLEGNEIPTDLTPTLVFVNAGLSSLRNRIKELHQVFKKLTQEKADIKKQHKELRKQHVTFHTSKKEKLVKLEEHEQKARDVQMLKFGRLIDLEKLERLGVNKAADDLRSKAAKDDSKRLKEVVALEKLASSVQEELTRVTKESTARLERIVQVSENKLRIEDALNQGQSTVVINH